MNCQQICKISHKDITEVKIFLKVLGGATFFLIHPVRDNEIDGSGSHNLAIVSPTL